MKHTIPTSPFSTRFSGKAKETELRIRSMVQGRRKRPALALLLLLAGVIALCGWVVVCRPAHSPAADQRTWAPLTSEYEFSFQEGETAAVLTGRLEDGGYLAGQDVTLSAPTFVENDAFYFPLSDVVSFLGGTCSVAGDTAQVSLLGKEIVYQADSRTFTQDGAAKTSVSPAVPLLRDGVFYIPNAFAGSMADGYTGLHQGRWFQDRNLYLLGGGLSSEKEVQESGLNQRYVEVDMKYNDLPDEVRRSFVSQGEVPVQEWSDAFYYVEKYTGEGMTLYVTRLKPGFQDLDSIDGVICGVKVTGEQYQTVKGIRVGDSAQRVQQLYGPPDPEDQRYQLLVCLITKLHIHTEREKVTSFELSNRYWGPNIEK